MHIVFCFILCILLKTKYILCFPSSSNECELMSARVVATVDSSSDKQMMSARSLLLGDTVAIDVFDSSLLSYHYSDALITMDRLLIIIVTYGHCYGCSSVLPCAVAGIAVMDRKPQ
jgi:hypothetical protein